MASARSAGSKQRETTANMRAATRQAGTLAEMRRQASAIRNIGNLRTTSR